MTARASWCVLALAAACIVALLLLRTAQALTIIGPAPIVATAASAEVGVAFDLHTYVATIHYDNGPIHKSLRAPIPPALLTAVENFAQARIEAAEGWDSGSSQITQ